MGHTHTPFVRRVGETIIVNPGSIGQPKTGRPFACYAVWEDGDILLKEYEYPIAETIVTLVTARSKRRTGGPDRGPGNWPVATAQLREIGRRRVVI